MSLDLEHKSCPVCHAYLFDEDDVVYCPTCGAPHHRSFYNFLGHCALEEFHGTEKQYDKLQEPAGDGKKEEIKIAYHTEIKEDENSSEYVKCGMCGEEYDKDLKSCPDCGAPNFTKFGGSYVVYDFLGGVPADADLGDGVTADEAKRFVAANTHRYIPKFAAMASGIKSSWNWLAFFFPSAWLLGRKMYKTGILTGVLSVAFSMLAIPFNKSLNYYIGSQNATSYTQLFDTIRDNLPKIGMAVVISAALGLVFNLVLKIYVGLKADYLYKKHAIATIKDIKANSEDIEYDFHRRGGISFIATLIGLFAVQYLPAIIATFAGV